MPDDRTVRIRHDWHYVWSNDVRHSTLQNSSRTRLHEQTLQVLYVVQPYAPRVSRQATIRGPILHDWSRRLWAMLLFRPIDCLSVCWHVVLACAVPAFLVLRLPLSSSQPQPCPAPIWHQCLPWQCAVAVAWHLLVRFHIRWCWLLRRHGLRTYERIWQVLLYPRYCCRQPDALQTHWHQCTRHQHHGLWL